MSTALIVVDVQRDFCPGGALAIKDGDKIVPRINAVVRAFTRAGLPVFFTRDWHPQNHVSFVTRGGLWPPHCVKNTSGAEFNESLYVPKGAFVISKGTEPDLEAYSGFQGTDLARQIRTLGLQELAIGGLATDYCVKETALDALKGGFKVSVMEDCVKGVELHPGDSEVALQEVRGRGGKIISSKDALNLAMKTIVK